MKAINISTNSDGSAGVVVQHQKFGARWVCRYYSTPSKFAGMATWRRWRDHKEMGNAMSIFLDAAVRKVLE